MQNTLNVKSVDRHDYINSIRSQSTLIGLSNRFISIKRPSRKDITLFKEQFYTLILNANSVERKIIAQNLSRSEYVPKSIILFFALEEIAVATAPLLYSPILKASDFNLILAKCTIEHGKVIAQRNDLEVSNVNALLKLDNQTREIYHILKTNSDLLANADIQKLMNTSLISNDWISKEAETTTNHIKQSISPEVTTGAQDLSQTLLKLANKGGRLARKPKGKPQKSSFNKLTSKQIETQLLATSRIKDLMSFATSVESFCGLNRKITFKILKNHDAGKLASLLCALDISDVTSARILLMMNRDIGRNAQIFKVVMSKFRNLDQEKCIYYFSKMGADFTQQRFHNAEDQSTTRYALSLAARDRRAALLKQQQLYETYEVENKLSA